ncbi:MAG: aryl-alcohol dehydrogenase-like predicted oxidoreductase [Gammaproteobacteria bacterium]|jgi:aryl-alcohol dehydrogenase-like predicted oxidoreductase
MKQPSPTQRADRRTFLSAAATLAVTGSLSSLASASPSNGQVGETERTSIMRVRIPKSGELLPCIGLGTSRTFDEDPAAENPDLVAVMDRFLGWGGSLVDSSPMYKRSEAVVGALCKTLDRSDLFYATKVWTKAGKQAGIEQMAKSEELMGTERFDLMQVHNLWGLEEQLETLQEWKASGRIRYVGVTEMRDFAKVESLVQSGQLDFIQVPYSVTDRTVEERVLPACIEHGVAALVMRPYQSGRLFKETADKQLPDWASDFGASSWGQLFLKFILGHEAVTIPIPATTKAHHLDDNMAAGVGRPLDQKARAELVSLLES